MDSAFKLRNFLCKAKDKNKDNVDFSYTSLTELDVLLNDMLAEHKFYEAAGVLEALSNIDKTFVAMLGKKEYMLDYIISSTMLLSCVLYWKSMQYDYACTLATLSIQYLKSKEYNICNKDNPIVNALFWELMADTYCFINTIIANQYYCKALKLYEQLDRTTQWGETCDWYWGFVSTRFERVIKACFGLEISFSELGQERAVEKRDLFTDIIEVLD